MAIVALIAGHVAARAQSYTITDLGVGVASAINSSGQVVGNWGNQMFLYDGTNTHQLGPLADNYFPPSSPGQSPPWGPVSTGTVAGISDSGIIVGTTDPLTVSTIALGFWYSAGKALLLYPPDGPTSSSSFTAVNSAGVAVGTHRFDGSSYAWLKGGVALAINSAGLAVGYTVGDAAGTRPCQFINNDASALSLSSLPGGDWSNLGSFTPYSQATAVNSAGTIVGFQIAVHQISSASLARAFMITNGVATQLGPEIDNGQYEVHGIADDGTVVGFTSVGGQAKAIIVRQGVVSDLNQLVQPTSWVLNAAKAINSQGSIVGVGTYQGDSHAFLLKPIGPGQPIAPSITTSPIGGDFALGATVTLSVSATGTAPLTYQWQKDQHDLQNQTNSILSIGNAQGTDTGSYRVVVTNAAGTTTSSAVTVTVHDPLLAVRTLAGLYITGAIGGSYRVDWRTDVSATNWNTLATVQLTNSPQLYVDVQSPDYPRRIYRAVRLP